MKAKFSKFILATVLGFCGLVGCKGNGTNVTPVTPCETHSWDEGNITTPPTTTSAGIMTYTCTVCNKTKTELIPALNNEHTHTYDNGIITTAPTTTSQGIKTFTCSICGQTKTELVPALEAEHTEHTWDNGRITTEPTEDAEGVKTYSCTVCGATKTESVPKKEKEKTFRVTYDPNGGTGTGIVDLNEYKSGDRVTAKDNTFTAPEGKEFINWCEEADGSGSYHRAGSTFRIYDNVTLYAQWLDIEVVPVDYEYQIKVNAPEGVSYTLSHQKAQKDTEVTLTLNVAAGVSLNGNPTSSQTTLTKTGDNTYKFTMPASAVTINVRSTIDGDVVITGDITAKLTDDDNDGIYQADVACDTQTSYQFTYVVKDNNGNPVNLSSMKLDETKCNAPVTFVTGGSNQLQVAGGFTYTFYYDSNLSDYNCYVVRKTVDVLPSNSRTLFNLFDGSMRSNSAVHPQGLTSISYEKTVSGNDSEQGYKVTNSDYEYKKLSDTESFAVATNRLKGNKKSYVYKNIDTAEMKPEKRYITTNKIIIAEIAIIPAIKVVSNV